VHFLGLTREDWLTGRDSVRARIQEILDRFDVILEATG
jgi:hypothetical protein